MITLALDASTYDGTVAVLDGLRIVAEGNAVMRGRDAERLMPAVESTLKAAAISLADVDRIVCGSGPGSFTSLRIAGSLAKGMALGANTPLLAASSLSLIVAGNASEPGRYLALIDAMRGEFFAAAFAYDGTTVAADGEAVLVSGADVDALAAHLKARAVGPSRDGNWAPHARGVRRLGPALAASGPVNLADWEPTYGRLAEAQVKLEAVRQ